MAEQDWKRSSLKILQDIRKNRGEEAPKEKACSKCKKPLPEGAIICPFCGRAVNEEGRKTLLQIYTKSDK